MVVRFEHVWISIPMMLIPIAFVVLMMGFIKVWMVGAPVKRRPFPQYSLHIYDTLPPDKPVPKAHYNPYKPGSGYPPAPRRPAPKYPPAAEEPTKLKYLKSHSGMSTPMGPPPTYTLGASVPQKPRAWQGKFI